MVGQNSNNEKDQKIEVVHYSQRPNEHMAPWMIIEVIQKGLKLLSLVVFSIIPSLKQMGFPRVLTHDDVTHIFHKIMSRVPLP